MDLTSGLLHQVGGNKDQMELLDELVTSRKFIAEPCINSIISKSINLGFRWDIIKEVFKETLSQFLSQHLGEGHHRLITPALLASIDLKQVYGVEERVIERILYASIQAEQQQQNTVNNTNVDLMTGSELDSFHSSHQQQQQHQPHPLTAMSLGGSATLSDESTSSMFPSVNPEPFYDMDHQMQQFLYQQRQIHQQIQKNSTVYKPPLSTSQQPQQHLSAYLQSLAGGMNKIGGGNTSQIKIPPSPQELIARANDKSNLRPIIIDGNDVGLSSHSNKQMFSFGRICRAVDYFEKRNHTVFVLLPSWRKEQIMMNASTSLSATSIGSNSSSVSGNSNSGTGQQTSSGPAISPTSSTQAPVLNADQEALLSMEDRSVLYCTPSKRVGNKHIICNDDKMILNFALNKDGIIVSNDNFKKYMNDSEGYKQVIEERVLMYSFIDDTFMPVEDPLGKNGPTLDNFLRFESIGNPEYQKRCPYKKRCTYGLKCKYWHPERDPEAMGNPMLNVPVRSSSTHQQPVPQQQQQSLHHIGNLSQLPVSMHSQQQQQQFKTVNQNMHDRIQEQKLVLEQILSKQSESVSFFEENGNKFGSGYFAQKTKPGEIDLRAMGPETAKAASFVPHQKMPYQQSTVQTMPANQNLSSLNQQMGGMSLSNERGGLYNPMAGSAYMPSFNSASLMSQQNTQFSEVNTPSAAGSRPIVSSNSTAESPSQSPNAVVNKSPSPTDQSTTVANSESSSEETEIKQPRQLTPNSLRQRLASLLNEEQIELFIAKYKDVTDETEAMFLASTWTIKQSFDF